MSLQQQQVDASELFNLLESPDIKVVEEIKALIHENLNSTREAWLLNGLVDYYVATQSENSLEILAGVREPHDKHLFDRLNEFMKGHTRVSSLTAIGFIVRKQPSWLHKIVNHQLFNTIIKCLRTDTDVPILMSACLIITTLLPVIPVSVSNHLNDIFVVFTRLAAFSIKKPANVPDIFLLHLQVGVYALFHRLYGMYPCNFLAFLRIYYSKKDPTAVQVFDQTIKPMLERVRMHPQLVTGSKEKEVSTSRWKTMEIHDITIECAKMSLDMIEGTAEGQKGPLLPMFGKRTSVDSIFWKEPPLTPLDSQAQFFSHHQPYQSIREHEASDQHSLVNQLKCSSTDLWSPSSICGMMTPPLSHNVTPSHSVSDLHMASITSHQGFHVETPTIQTPTMSNSSPYEESGNYGSTRVAMGRKRSLHSGGPHSAIHSPGLDPHSPMKKDFTTEPPSQARKMAAKKLPLPSNPTLETSKTFDSSSDVSSHKLNRSTSEYGPKKDICDSEKAAAKDHVLNSLKSPQLVQSHSMPVIADKSSGDGIDRAQGEVSPTSDDFQTASEFSVATDHSMPSVDMLPKVIEKLSEADSEDISRLHDADDDEVTDINCSHISIQVDAEPSDHSAKLNDPQLTAESMQQFRKSINRIRFNSMNTSNNDSTLKRTLKKVKRVRCSSCPDFHVDSAEASVAGSSLEEEDEGGNEAENVTGSARAVTTENLPSSYHGGIAVTCGSTTVTHTHSTTVHHVYTTIPPGSVRSSHGSAPPSRFPPFIDTSHTDHGVDNMPRHFPYEDLLPLSLPFTPITQCQNCMDRSYTAPDLQNQSTSTLLPQMTTTTPPRVLGSEVPLFTALSPPELLDRQIQLGGEVHAKELSHIPLTSGQSVSWTHFGGVPPTDEVNILRGQNMLLHTQMMYERHKREQHAIRNRRLLGKIVKNVALEEQNSAMRDQLKLQEKNIEQLQEELKSQQEGNRRISDEKKDMELKKESELVKLRRSQEELEYKTKELQSMLVAEKDEKKNMLQELQSARSELFNLHEEMYILNGKVAHADDLQEQIRHLNKEVLLMGELQKKYREKMAALSKNDTLGFGQKQIIEAYKSEIGALKSSLDQTLVLSESLKSRVVDLEEVVKHKDVVITDQKRATEKMKNLHSAKFESVNAKYRSQQNVIQTLESSILELHHKYRHSHRYSSHKSSHGSQDNSPETSPEQKENGVSHRTRPIQVRGSASLDHTDASEQELDASNNAHVSNSASDYLMRSITTDGTTVFQKYQPYSSYPRYSKPLYSNFTSASEGQKYDSSYQPSFLMPYDSMIRQPEDFEASAATADLNFLMSSEHKDFTSASASNLDAQDDGGASLNVDSGIVSLM